MPIYEYRCNECGHVFPRLQRIGATSEGVTCPKCESSNVERVVSAFASSGSSSGLGSGASAPSCSGFT